MDEKATIENSWNKKRVGLDLALLLALTLLMFWDVLFVSNPPILSLKDADLYHLFIHLRAFTFDQLKQGNLPLWNPYYFSGQPCLGGLQSAPLYPPNLIYLLPSVPHAVNGSIALHVFMMGLTMYLWSRYRRMHPTAALFTAALAMFGGTFFLHVTPGSLPNLCAMVWTPLILLSVDGWFDEPGTGWILLGIFGVSMQILAGHPQYLFYTGVSALLYSGLRAVKRPSLKTCAGLPLIYSAAVILTAVQFFPALQAAGESARAGGVSYEFASSFSFPPENFVTLLVPGFFGDLDHVTYWGRGLLWEMCPYFGLTGLVLFFHGAFHGSRSARRFSVTVFLVLVLLALGGRTPLLKFLYGWVPGFDLFRGSSKFMFQACLFMIMVAGIGLDGLIRRRQGTKPIRIALLLAALVLAGASISIHLDVLLTGSKNLVRPVLAAVSNTHETPLPPLLYSEPGFVGEAAKCAGLYLGIASLTCLILWFLFSILPRRRKGVWCIALLGVIEVFVFAKSNRPTFPADLALRPSVADFLSNHPGDYRILDARDPNMGMSLKVSNIWGYDTPLKRYAEFMAFTQGRRIDGANEYTAIRGYHPLYRMLRCRFHFVAEGETLIARETLEIMPRLALIRDYRVIRDRDQILEAMNAPDFEPRMKVILEEEPFPLPVQEGKDGTAEILDSSTDHLTIQVETPRPAVLLVTDPYSSGWSATALEGSVQKRYRIMRANYILMAVPLSGGRHLMRIEYLPAAYRIGRWLSAVSSAAYLLICLGYFRRPFGPSRRGIGSQKPV